MIDNIVTFKVYGIVETIHVCPMTFEICVGTLREEEDINKYGEREEEEKKNYN